MTATYCTDPLGNRQARFIPFQAFDGRYLDILYHSSFPDILTVTEKKLLKLLNEYAFMDGRCYPRQTTLAGRLDCTTRQIRRLVRSLEQKGFIEVERPGLVARHVLRRTCHYFFLRHPVYETVMSAQMSAENRPDTININQQVSKTPAPPRPGADQERKTEKQPVIPDARELEPKVDLKELFERIERCGTRFHPAAFYGKYIDHFPASAIAETLEAVHKKLTSGMERCGEIWGYAVAVLRRVGPNHNEAESIREAERFKAELPGMASLGALLRGIG